MLISPDPDIDFFTYIWIGTSDRVISIGKVIVNKYQVIRKCIGSYIFLTQGRSNDGAC